MEGLCPYYWLVGAPQPAAEPGPAATDRDVGRLLTTRMHDATVGVCTRGAALHSLLSA